MRNSAEEVEGIGSDCSGSDLEDADDFEEEDGPKATKRSKISRELPPEATIVFKNWMLSEKNISHPVCYMSHLILYIWLIINMCTCYYINTYIHIWSMNTVSKFAGLIVTLFVVSIIISCIKNVVAAASLRADGIK